ncbi:sensor histidine kinase [Luteirhabdus pelagi]|uniref:sensor histidine kinase n=1 Tax=Luteirhabdus pelagi TaxID=2792783 RepID=UPI001939BA0B|nr:histidine kinase [Luteirhabdus pelagi]
MLHFGKLMFLLVSMMVYGQQQYYYSTTNGLPSNTVYDIVQDKDGFIWMATSKGITKYDGDSFSTFTVQQGLPNNDTWKLESTPDGKIWYAAKSNRQGYIENDSIYSFPIEHNKTISPGGLAVLDTTVNYISGTSHFLRNQIWKSNHTDGLLGVDDDDAFFISDTLILKRETSGFSIYTISENRQPVKNHEIKIENFSSSGKIIQYPFGVYGNTYWRIQEESLLLVNLKTANTRIIPYKGKLNRHKQFVWANDSQIQWKNGDSIQVYGHDFTLHTTIYFPSLSKYNRAILDRDGNLWMASLSNGVQLIPSNILNTKYYFQNKKVQKLEIFDDTLYAGILNEPLHYYDKGAFRPTMLIGQGNIYNIRKTKEHGLYLLAAEGSNAERHPIPREFVFEEEKQFYRSSPDSKLAMHDFVTNNQKKYILTHDLIAMGTVKSSGKYQALKKMKGGVRFSVVYDSILILASDGLHLIKDDTVSKISEANKNRPIPYLSSVQRNTQLYLGTDGFGVEVLEGGELYSIPATQGLSVNNMVLKGNFLWLATQKGVKVLKIDPSPNKSKIVHSYYQADGLLDRNINDLALKDSTLFAATDLGLSAIDLKSTAHTKKPVLYFKEAKDTLQYLSTNHSNISVSFGAINFSNQQNIHYSYRLLPSQNEFEKTHSKTITFPSLAPGQYALEVKAIDQHENWNSKSIYLTIIPQWWQTDLAKTIGICIALLLLGTTGFYLYNIAKSREQRKSERAKRLVTLELQALRSQMNPHFVHNSLNAIQYFVQRNEVALSEKYLSRFSKLIRQFFEFSRKQTLLLSEEVALITNYLEIEKLRFEEKLNYSIYIDDTIDLQTITIPSMLLQPIIENAINHGIFHKSGPGKVEIRFVQPDKDVLKVTIQDNGIGLEKAKEMQQYGTRKNRSNSTEVLQERLTLLQQNNDWNITYSIEDLKTYGKSGTRVIVTLITIHENKHDIS